MKTQDTILFVCDANDYHAIDWYDEVRRIASEYNVLVVTDIAVRNDERNHEHLQHKVLMLSNINWLLLKRQSQFANHWRNVVKMLSIPLQVLMLRRLSAKFDGALFHAHSMYYIVLCWLAKVKFIATPMGSDVLVRPGESRLYKWMTTRSLRAATVITVDSLRMQSTVEGLSGRSSNVVQNGIDVRAIRSLDSDKPERRYVTSIRGIDPNYQIHRLVKTRNATATAVDLTIVYPFAEAGYMREVQSILQAGDRVLGPLPRMDLYKVLVSSLLVISIPQSDSSPRSVYEAIFCGACIAATKSSWIDALPPCMRSRITIVDLSEPSWLVDAMANARRITSTPYTPSIDALVQYDQHESMKRVIRDIYRPHLQSEQSADIG